MLKLLKIKNLAILSSVELEFGPGLTLLTGETGAGKSILMDALGLLLGARASTDLIRTGEESAVVEGIAAGPAIRAALERLGLPVEEDEVVLRREVHASGKGRATVNGALVPAGVLRELGPAIAVLHGQHEPQGLLDPRTHLDLLDHQAGHGPLRGTVAAAHTRLLEVESALSALRRDRREAERRRESLEFQVAEIDKAAILPGEEDALRQEKVLQANAGRLAGLSAEAFALLYEDEGAILSRLGQVYRRVEELARLDPRFAPHMEARASVQAQLDDLAYFLRDYQDALQVSPGRLDEIESRLSLLERLKRKYGATAEEVLAFADAARAELASLGSPEERERALVEERETAARRFLDVAADLSRKRRLAARELETRAQKELAQLAMEKTRFRVEFRPETPSTDPAVSDGWSERGLEDGEFLLSPNPGEELRPLARIASGGELSRIMLALKTVATLDAPGKTLVFDEVDAGIGGRVAEVVGRKLKAMAERHQVLCVTHLPQIASMADQHYLVRKRTDKGRTSADVRSLDGAERVEEVARMLAGETVSEAARKHAREMVRQGERS
jgi:DNA repair protein RecN (Recombination protein N)